MSIDSKEPKKVSFVQIESEGTQVVFGLPPYMSAKNWALLVGDKTEGAVKKDLQTGAIARYQPVEGGRVYVNVLKEMQRAETAPDF
ncbi:hypothetical protein ACFQ45_13085 [Rhodanobacter aciditrophus]|uniref:Uncharacterized protein n=1 Tax=Rhodanobacter aciditrophus TaxID=1623218 RepID=A0ABW4B321_9GAMM